MFKRPTVVILGAGASAEFGMPVGPKLLSEIKALLDRGAAHHRFLGLIHEKMHDDRAKHLTNAAPRLLPRIDQFDTIDDVLHFVSQDRDAVDVGKAAIAYQIAKAESESLLYRARQDKEAEKQCDTLTWARAFLRIAMAGVRSEDYQTYFSKVTIIDFNYDRVLKQYLYDALQRLCGLAPVDAALCLKQLNVIRPYGSLGVLDWEGITPYLAFGDPAIDLFAALNGIRTFTEERSSGVMQQINSALNGAQVCLVLGFGFHVQNIEMLSCTRSYAPNPIFMTAYGMDGNLQAVTDTMKETLKSTNEPTTMSTVALGLMNTLKPSISLAVS
jgi:hypothetical protein